MLLQVGLTPVLHALDPKPDTVCKQRGSQQYQDQPRAVGPIEVIASHQQHDPTVFSGHQKIDQRKDGNEYEEWK